MSPRPARWRRAVVASQVVALGVLVTACNQESLVDNVSDDASPSDAARWAEDGRGRGRVTGGDGAKGPAPEPTEERSRRARATRRRTPWTRRGPSTSCTPPTPSSRAPSRCRRRRWRRITAIDGVKEAVPLSWASASINGRTLDIAAVDATRFRNFMPVATAQAEFMWTGWRRRGRRRRRDRQEAGRRRRHVPARLRRRRPWVHVGAYAPLHDELDKVTPFDVVMNAKRGEQIGLPVGNALLLSTGTLTPSKLKKEFDKVLDDDTTFRTLAIEFDTVQQGRAHRRVGQQRHRHLLIHRRS